MKAVALLLCIRLALVNFLPNQDVHELSGVVALIEHYHDHENADHDHDFSLFDFLSLHYADQTHKNAAGHEDLPFQHNHSNLIANYYLAPITRIAFAVPHFFVVVKPTFLFEPRLFSKFSFSIWQPPKF